MSGHNFVFQPGNWLGEGTITLNMMEEQLSFFTRWKAADKDGSGRVECVQEIQVAGLADMMMNQFLFYDISSGSFAIELENQSLGQVVGKGMITDDLIAWEFRKAELGFEGFELYEKQGNDSYKMHAEYATNDAFRTVIHGSVWKQTEEGL